jgi:excisionase family DNA binding protein
MNRRPTQFGVRENTASSRQHALRLAVQSRFDSICPEDVNPRAGFNDPSHGASNHAATLGEKRDKDPLLTIKEVAELLRVPVSWVYGRTRKRAPGRLPGYRLGKYWRFSEDEVLAWVRSNGGGPRAA